MYQQMPAQPRAARLALDGREQWSALTIHEMSSSLRVVLASLVVSSSTALAAPDRTVADGPAGMATYTLLGRAYGLETPDCGHMVPHWTEVDDAELGKPVFVAHAHVNQDDDRCMNTDRQRTELRGRGEGVVGPEGTTVWYRWKFKLPAGFQASGAFTHIFQIKAYGNGHGSGAPIITLTPRNDTFAVDGSRGRHGLTSLGKFLNTWVVVEMKILHANAGRLEVTIRRLSNGEVFMQYAGNLDMYDDGSSYGAPKHGIYRSLNDRGALRDEQVRFADFCASRVSAAECEDGATPPPPPTDAGATPPADGGVDEPAPPDAAARLDATTSPERDGGGAMAPSPLRADASAPKPAAPDAGTPGSPATPPDDTDPTPKPARAASSGCAYALGAGQGGPAPGLALVSLLVLGSLARRRYR